LVLAQQPLLQKIIQDYRGQSQIFLRKYHEKTRAKNTRERTSRVRSAHERARILTSLFLSSSCENRVQTIGTGQSPFSPALTKYGSFAKIGYRPQELVSPHFRRRGFLKVG